jgi:hypothetical protein
MISKRPAANPDLKTIRKATGFVLYGEMDSSEASAARTRVETPGAHLSEKEFVTLHEHLGVGR